MLEATRRLIGISLRDLSCNILLGTFFPLECHAGTCICNASCGRFVSLTHSLTHSFILHPPTHPPTHPLNHLTLAHTLSHSMRFSPHTFSPFPHTRSIATASRCLSHSHSLPHSLTHGNFDILNTHADMSVKNMTGKKERKHGQKQS